MTRTATAVAALAVALLASAAPAAAQGTYWTRADLLRDFFPTSDRVTYRQLELTRAQRKEVGKRLGYAAPAALTLFYGLKEGHVTGYAILDDELGQHEPISFGVLTDPAGRVQRVEVMVYRETHGDEIRRARFREQFKGKRATDPLRPGQDVVTIAGATISSRALAVGTRRALVLLDELVIKPGLSLARAR